MKYLKRFFFCFLIVYFANHVLPGIQVMDTTKLPHFGGDLLYAAALGLMNCSIIPFYKVLHRPVNVFRLAYTTFGLNFIAYALLKVLPVGIRLETVEGYLIAGIVVSASTILLNYQDLKSGDAAPPHDSSDMKM